MSTAHSSQFGAVRPLNRPGSTLPVVTLLLVLLVGMVAFAIDIGYIAHGRTQLQATADAGSLGGLAQLYGVSGATQDFTSARAEARNYIGGPLGNQPGLTVPDVDIEFGFFEPTAALGSRFTTEIGTNRVNAVRVTLRRDGTTNPRLPLFFAPVIGKSNNSVQARATSWVPIALGVLPNAELIPYVAHVDYFRSAAGLPARPANSPGFENIAANSFADTWVIGPPGTRPTPGPDGAKELLLFDGDKNAPGNFGSIDLGSASNGTPELARQLRDGPTAGDFAIMGAAGKLAADGSLQAPVTLEGDTGISSGVKDDWAAIIGRNKIIPLYDTVGGTGNNAAYHIVGFAGVRIVAADLQGNPKRVWVQPTSFYSTHVTGVPGGFNGPMHGVHGPPKLVIP